MYLTVILDNVPLHLLDNFNEELRSEAAYFDMGVDASVNLKKNYVCIDIEHPQCGAYHLNDSKALVLMEIVELMEMMSVSEYIQEIGVERKC